MSFSANSIHNVINRAVAVAKQANHEYLTTEHMLYAMILEDNVVQEVLDESGLDINKLQNSLEDYLENNITRFPVDQQNNHPIETQTLRRVLQRATAQCLVENRKGMILPSDILLSLLKEENTHSYYFLMRDNLDTKYVTSMINEINSEIFGHDASMEDEEEMTDSNGKKKRKSRAQKALDEFCVNLNHEVEAGRIDPIIGREDVIEQTAATLQRRTKNNVIYVGESGVGKTAIAEGLAFKIVNGGIYHNLEDAVVYNLDVGGLIAGARFRGDFEERLKLVLKGIEELSETQSSILFIDEIHTIIGTGSVGKGDGLDLSNLLKPALSKGYLRCIGSTTLDEFKKGFEKDRALVRRFKKIQITEPSVEEAKEILRGIASVYEDHHLVKYTEEAIDAAVDLTSKYIHDRQLPDKAIDIIDGVAARYRIHNKDEKVHTIDVKMIEDEISTITKIPKSTIESSESVKIENLEKNLKNFVFGQNSAIETLVQTYKIAKAGLREPNKPVGSYLMTGPTGVGKTEVAKQLASNLGIEVHRFDMSEYMERHTVSRLVGAPPGYVGYDEEGLLIKAVDDNPVCVLLLDEIEKAHQDVFNVLLQIMDNGRLTSPKGKQVDFRNVILLMTSNVGAAELEKNTIGFGGQDDDRSENQDQVIKQMFTPEFRNRLDAILKFNRLSKDLMINIVCKFIDELNKLSNERNVGFEVTDAAKEWLAEKGYDPKFGARPLNRVIHENVKKPAAEEMLHGKLVNGGTAVVDVKDNGIKIKYLKRKSKAKS